MINAFYRKNKLLLPAVILTASLTLTGCGSSGTDSDSSSSTTAETEAATEAETVTETEIESEAAADDETESDTEAETETESDAAVDEVTESDTEAETETESDAATDDETESDTEADAETESDAATDDETESDTEAETNEEAYTNSSLSSVTPSDYLVENAADYITVGELEGLEVTQYTHEITDEDVQDQIDYELYYMSEETIVERAAEMGDLVYLELTATVDGSDDSVSEDTYFTLGEADYGDEFDEALVGASADETVSFDITFDDDAGDYTMIDEDWEGETVHFEAVIEAVCEISVPEYNDDYVAENTDYSTTEEYEEAIREYLEAEYEEQSYSDVLDDLISYALDECEFSEIPEDLYESCREDVLSDYGYFLGTTDVDEILEAFDMTEDELEQEIQDTAQRRLLISYICVENGVEITGEDYAAFAEEYAEYYGYDSAEDFEEDLGRSYLIWSMYESEAAQILYETAEITEESYEELYLIEDEEEDLETEIYEDAEEPELDEEYTDVDDTEISDADDSDEDADTEESSEE